VLRSLPSIALRYHAHDRSARALAEWLQSRPEIARVLHPALPDSPGHAHWRQTCSAAAGLFSIMFDASYSAAQVDRFVDALKLFRIGYSWAGPVSLVVPYDLPAMRSPAPYEGTLVRLSIGLEAEADLRADLAQALSVL
jgi:cysteine-S-conjugate beta-lyase